MDATNNQKLFWEPYTKILIRRFSRKYSIPIYIGCVIINFYKPIDYIDDIDINLAIQLQAEIEQERKKELRLNKLEFKDWKFRTITIPLHDFYLFYSYKPYEAPHCDVCFLCRDKEIQIRNYLLNNFRKQQINLYNWKKKNSIPINDCDIDNYLLDKFRKGEFNLHN